MCKTDPMKKENDTQRGKNERTPQFASSGVNEETSNANDSSKNKSTTTTTTTTPILRQRRGKRVKESDIEMLQATLRRCQKNSASSKHKGGNTSPLQVMLPSLIALVILGVAVMGKMGFRGRPTVAGIDLGTTNSVICVQQQQAEVVIDCIRDPRTNSPIIPSVVSFLPRPQSSTKSSSSRSKDLTFLPDTVIVGSAAKEMIEHHPHTTIYHAKRILGRAIDDPAITSLQSEVEFRIGATEETPVFLVPDQTTANHRSVSPVQIGEYVIRYLRQLVVDALQHDAVRTAVICVPAQFDEYQRSQTVQAVTAAGFTVSRILDEPVAAALAYGLDQTKATIFVLVYDFGGGTLDVSVLQLSGSDYVDVLSSNGDDQLGGSNFDSAIADHLRQTFLSSDSGLAIIESDLEEQVMTECPETQRHFCTLASLHVIGEKFKIELSNIYGNDTATVLDEKTKREMIVESECLTVTADKQAKGSTKSSINCDELVSIPLSLSLWDFENTVAAPLLDRAIRPIDRVLEAVSMDHDDIDEVVMVGGTTRMPIVRQLVHQALPQAKLNTHIDPDITVAYGAASVMD